MAAVVSFSGIPLETSAIILSVTMGMMSVLMTGLIAHDLATRDVHNPHRYEPTVLFASSILGLHPVFISYSGRILTETTFCACTLCSMVLVIRLLKTSRVLYALPAGILTGLAALTREAGAAYIPLIIILPLLCRTRFRHRAAAACLAFLSAMAIYLPATFSGARDSIMIYNLIGHQSHMTVLDHERSIHSLDPTASGFEIDRLSETSVIRFVTENPGYMLERVGNNVRNCLTIIYRMAGSYLLFFSCLGCIAGLTPGRFTRPHAVLYLYTLATVCVYLPFHMEFRYLVPAIPFMSLFGAFGIDALQRLAVRARIAAWIPVSGAAILVAIGLAGTYYTQTKRELSPAANLIEERELGTRLKTIIPAQSVIMARKPDTAYYAGAEFKMLPFAGWPGTHHYACLQKVNYLVLSDRFRHLRPFLADLYDPARAPDDLELILSFTGSNAVRLLVYKLHCPDSESSATPDSAGTDRLRFGR